MSAINWLAAWFLFLLILLALVQTKVGSTIVYYILWLNIVLLLVVNYQQVTSVLQAGGIVPQSSSSS